MWTWSWSSCLTGLAFGAGCGPVLGGGGEGAQEVAELGGRDLLVLAQADRCFCEQIGRLVGLVGMAAGGVPEVAGWGA